MIRALGYDGLLTTFIWKKNIQIDSSFSYLMSFLRAIKNPNL